MRDEERRFGRLNDLEPQVGAGWTKPMILVDRRTLELELADLVRSVRPKPAPLPPLEGCEVCAAAGRDHEWTAVRPSHPESPCVSLKLCAECSQAQRVADVVPQHEWPLLAALRPCLPWVGITLAFSALMALSFL